jgi:hypothetical protein
MNLSPKAARFVIEALEHYQKYHDERLRQEGLSDDEASDLLNDRSYLEAIKHDFQAYHDALLRQPGRAQTSGCGDREGGR